MITMSIVTGRRVFNFSSISVLSLFTIYRGHLAFQFYLVCKRYFYFCYDEKKNTWLLLVYKTLSFLHFNRFAFRLNRKNFIHHRVIKFCHFHCKLQWQHCIQWQQKFEYAFWWLLFAGYENRWLKLQPVINGTSANFISF